MFKIFRKELDWNGAPLVMETGKVARQADGAVMVSLGETTVLCTAVAAHSPRPGQDFFPLTVNYQEKAFAAGKIPEASSNAKAAHPKMKPLSAA